MAAGPCGTHFKAVLHAVAIDGFYGSSRDLVGKAVRRALEMAAESSARRVALVALATGFGPMTMAEFGCSIKPLLYLDLCPLEEIVVCVLRSYEAAELRAALTVKP